MASNDASNQDDRSTSDDDAMAFSAVNRALAQPTNLVARGGIYLLTLCLGAGLAWASVFDVGDWVTASGTVYPASELPIAEAIYGGVVSELPVRDGDWIAKGAPIIVIKSDRLLELRRELIQRTEEFQIANDALAEVQTERLPALLAEEEAKKHRLTLIDVLQDTLEVRREAAAAAMTSERENLEGRIQLADRSISVFTALRDKELVAENRMLEMQQNALEVAGSLTQLESRSREKEVEFVEQSRRLDLETATLEEEIQRLAETRRQTLSDARSKVRLAQIAKDRAAAAVADLDDQGASDALATRYVVSAPAGGTIIDLEIVNPGQTADAGQIIARIVPDGAEMRVRLNVANRDVSRLSEGDVVRFKVDAFQYTRHGVLQGRINRLAQAVRANDKDGTFTADVVLDQDYFVVDGMRQYLSPGMRGIVEIQVGSERLITRFFDPLKVLFEPEAAQR